MACFSNADLISKHKPVQSTTIPTQYNKNNAVESHKLKTLAQHALQGYNKRRCKWFTILMLPMRNRNRLNLI